MTATSQPAAGLGVLHVFNPEGIGGLPSTFRWNPLRGCEHPAVALQRAAAFTAATESKGLHDVTFWIGKASAVLASFLHAAALDRRTMRDVYQWAHGIDDDAPEHILAAHRGNRSDSTPFTLPRICCRPPT